MAKETEKKETEKKEEPKAAPAKGTLKIHIHWNNKPYKAGDAVPEGLVDWLKKANKKIADYIVE